LEVDAETGPVSGGGPYPYAVIDHPGDDQGFAEGSEGG